MDGKGRSCSSSSSNLLSEEEMDLRRGPWTVEEDLTLINYIAKHGEGRWNLLSRCAGLKRTGKSCRLRWLNYLRPDVRRGNITLEEQLMILELHSRWGNRWSKIAQHLPGRTDNEIKNYWRTRVQKHAKQLKCDVNSKQFKDTMRYLWMPRLVERIQATANCAAGTGAGATTAIHQLNNLDLGNTHVGYPPAVIGNEFGVTPENSSTGGSSDSFATQVSPVSDFTDYYSFPVNTNVNSDYFPANQIGYCESMTSPSGFFNHGVEFQSTDQIQQNNNQWMDAGDTSDNLWNVEDFWVFQPQLNYNI